MVLVCACDGLFTLPVREKALSWTGDGLFPLPVEEKAIMGLGVRLRLPFPPACRGKGCFMDLARVCDGLFPLPVEEKTVSWTLSAFAMAFSLCLSRKRPYRGRSCLFAIAFALSGRRKGQFQVSSASPQRGLERTPKVARELPSQKLSILTIFAS